MALVSVWAGLGWAGWGGVAQSTTQSGVSLCWAVLCCAELVVLLASRTRR